jgi:sugar phosphate isomerase/epimerase
MLVSLVIAGSLLAPRPMKFQLGVQAWSFHTTTVYEAIERTALTGARNIELFPGQQLTTDSKNSVGPWMSDAEFSGLQTQLKKFNVTPVAFGVTGIDQDYTKAKPLFIWAKKLGLRVINTESVSAMDTIERLVKEFDIKVGFHNHPRQKDNPNYKIWDPNYVFSIVKDRDARIGSCADTGHWVRSGIKPVDALKILKGRVVSSHLKDLNMMGEGAYDLPYGTGVSDVVSILKEYDRIGLDGSVSVEYENKWDANVPDVSQCIGFVRGIYGR